MSKVTFNFWLPPKEIGGTPWGRRRLACAPRGRLQFPWAAAKSFRLVLLLFLARCAFLAAGDLESPFVFQTWELPPGSDESVWGAGGVCLHHREKPGLDMFLWLYEWNLFDAVEKGEHTHGAVLPGRAISANQEEATVSSDGIEFRFEAVEDGAIVRLIITNRSDHDWPPLAAVIPCFNPGPAALRSRRFSDDGQTRTFFLSAKGLEALRTREIHFRNELLPVVIGRLSPLGQFVFSPKWPTSRQGSSGGLLVRESEDGEWVTGIAWEDYLAAQGHNPWKCMHLAVRVGPLPRGETKKVRGRVYLFRGNRNDCLAKYRKEFSGDSTCLSLQM